MSRTVDTRSMKLTDYRRSVLELIESEGAVSASDVARNDGHGGNMRSAHKVLKWLKENGFTLPIRSCEFILSPAGQAWLDFNRKPLTEPPHD